MTSRWNARGHWHAASYAPIHGIRGSRSDTIGRIAAIALVAAVYAETWQLEMAPPERPTSADTVGPVVSAASGTGDPDRETFLAGYAGAPFYYRSDVRMSRRDDTDIVLKRLGWDGDALYFPIDGGVRSVHWRGPLGFMIDFLHNKAIARLGRGAHGRKLAHPVIEEVEVSGRLKGEPRSGRVKLTDVFDRLEFTHGHNVLLATPMARLGRISPAMRPYFGLGAGVAVPHVEVWFPGDANSVRTSEYQYAGPAAQAVAGLEISLGKLTYFVEYKFTYAWISAAMTGDQSWKNFNMPGDLMRQLRRWLAGGAPSIGTISTTLGAHQIVAGAGYTWRRPPATVK